MSKETNLERAQRRVLEQREWVADHGGTLQGYIDRYNTPESIEQHGEGYAVNIYYADTDELLKLEAELRLAELQKSNRKPVFIPMHYRSDGTLVAGHYRR